MVSITTEVEVDIDINDLSEREIKDLLSELDDTDLAELAGAASCHNVQEGDIARMQMAFSRGDLAEIDNEARRFFEQVTGRISYLPMPVVA